MKCKGLLFLVSMLVVVATLGSARLAAQDQTTGGMTGVVMDPSNAVVPGAVVELKDNAKGVTREAKTNASGAYQFAFVLPGSYTVTVKAAGFEPVNRTVDVPLGQPVTVDFNVHISGAGTVITVTEAAPLTQTENGNTLTTLSQQQVSEIPNPGNDLTYIAQIAPGVVMNTQGGFGNFEAFGLPGTSNLFTINGQDNNDPFLNLNNSGATNLLLGQNDVQEATVVTNGYSGQYGSFAGVSVNYVTKSGGNDFHGNAIYYWNGSAFNANDFFNNSGGRDANGNPNFPKAFSNANQWAASFGGRIKRDKAFFFVNTEGLRVIVPTSTPVVIPTPQFAAATLANLAIVHPASVPFYQNAFNLYSGAVGAKSAVDNQAPGSFNVVTGCDPATQLCLPCDPTTQMCTAIPTGDGCGSFQDNPAFFGSGAMPCSLGFNSTATNFTHEYTISPRGDWIISERDRAFLQYNYDNGVQASGTDPINPIFNAVSTQPQHQAQLVETHTFGPTMVNQIILSGTYYKALFGPSNLSATLAAFPTTLGFADASFTGLGGTDNVYPQGRNVTFYQVSDDISKTIGNHSLRGGIKFVRSDTSDHDFGVNTSGTLTVNTLNDFYAGGFDPVLGSGDSFSQNFATSQNEPIAIYQFGVYLQDEWKVRSNLTLSFTLRAEHQSNPVCQTNCFAQLTGPFNAVSHDPNQPYNQAIQANRHQALLGLQAVQWEPRFSFAWSPFSDASGWKSNLVLRGGVGIFYDIFPGSIADNVATNSPLNNGFTVGPNLISPAESSNVFVDAASSNQAFLSGFASGETLAQIVAANPFFFPPSVTVTDRKTHAPEFEKWSLEVQKGFGSSTSLSLSYVGNHGIYIPVFNNSVNAFCDPTNPNTNSACPSGPFPGLPTAPVDPRFSFVTQVTSAGVSNYNGLVASFTHRFGASIVQVNYTYSHALDEISNGGFFAFSNRTLGVPQDPNNLRNLYGNADYDVRHSLNANYVWQIPVKAALHGHGPDRLVQGWQVAGAVFARTAFPYSVVDNSTAAALSLNNYGGFILPDFLGGPVPDCGKFAAIGVNLPVNTCLAATQFATSGFGVRGLKNLFRGPNYVDTDMTISKKTKVPGWERAELSLAFQFFNLFNHPNFNLPRPDISASDFGQITTTVSVPTSILGSGLGGDASPRLIQIKASLTF